MSLSLVPSQSQVPGRIIALAHRVKARMRDGEAIDAVPTKVLINTTEGEPGIPLSLEDERAELDFVHGCFPVEWAAVDPANPDHRAQVKALPDHHVKWKKVNEEDADAAPEELVSHEGTGKSRTWFIATKFATAFDGLRSSDTCLMALGGSGNPLSFALSNKCEKLGGALYRLPGHALRAARGEKPADQEVRDQSELETLCLLWKGSPESFHKSDRADRERILVATHHRAFKEAQLARMACAARLRQAVIGRIFMREGGEYEEGLVDRWFDDEKASDPLFEAFVKIEAKCKKQLEKAVLSSRVWQILEPIPGVGPSIAGALIASIGDIRRFSTDDKLMAFGGLHTLRSDGKKWQKGETPGGAIMARRRRGQLSNWNPSLRQSLFLLADQFNRRPDSFWGQKLLANKKTYREIHPEMIIEDGKKRYNDGHIHKMALWKTLRQFLRWLHRKWWKLENGEGAGEVRKAA